MVTRRLQFKGSLFDGQSAQKHPVLIELTPHHISLTGPDLLSLTWLYSNIHWIAGTVPFQIEDRLPEGKQQETLVVEDPDFFEIFQKISPVDFSRKRRKNSFNWKTFLAGVLVLLLFFYGALKIAPNYFVDHFVEKIPVVWEETLGDMVLSAFPVDKDPDPEVIQLLNNITRLLKQSVPEGTPYDLKIYILPTKKVNALALPGGNIIIFEGLLKLADSPEELAGVLAHEAQHIFLKHSTQGILRNFASGVLLALVMGDANAVMDGLVSIAGQINTLGFSRKMELEADRKGMELMLHAKINPQGMLSIFEKLMKEELRLEVSKNSSSTKKNSRKIFSYLSTHPSAQSRLKILDNQIKENSKKFWIPLYPNSNWSKIKP